MCFPSARVAVAQSSSLSLFTNRDAELEQRAMLLKRLAFTIYSSEVDQYQKYLPDIQGTHTSIVHAAAAAAAVIVNSTGIYIKVTLAAELTLEQPLKLY